ncbi:TonB-dependent receptor plug domain-containing protein [Altererythrobacter sp.]|uniref:TonB-dependent receptor plug domain-containing protein n=1 Tax=Altererythrobacter sp. TaxID=1872480 RepID=UPI003D06B5DA
MKLHANAIAPRSTIAALLASITLPLTSPALANEDSGNADQLAQTPTSAIAGQSYDAAFFDRFAPRTALEMLRQVPGFTIKEQEEERGLGQTRENVLLDGERLASKSSGTIARLSRISADRVVRIEIVDGAALGIPGLSGQVANVITSGGAVSGRFEYQARVRPKYAKPSWIGGEISASGSSGAFDWTAAIGNQPSRGGAGGGRGVLIFDGAGELVERRTGLIRYVAEQPSLSGSVKWTSPGGVVANLSGNLELRDTRFTNDESRDSISGVDSFRDFTNLDDGHSYEISGDIDFPLGPGRLKLIGIERFEHGAGPATSITTYADGSPDTGFIFDQSRDSGERIGRAEYRWNMAGGDWQLDAEAAFNRLDQAATLAELDASGAWVEIDFPEGTGGVSEDRYEAILTHTRSLGAGLTLSIGAGGEYSKLAQTGPGGLTRTFQRPKGSLSLAWTASDDLDLSFKLARTVGQLSFSDFLAGVNLELNNQNAGNVRLVPQQAWEADLEIKHGLGPWGSASLNAYAHFIEDYIDFIPVGGGESRGNVDHARLLGVKGNATINFDPVGWKGAKLDIELIAENSRLDDPLTGEPRFVSNHDNLRANGELRWDIPDSSWAVGAGFDWRHKKQTVRLFETGKNYEGPLYTSAFIENKDVFGLTVALNVFNLTAGEAIFNRTVYDGLRDRSPILFREDRRYDVSTIYSLSISGNF